MNIHRFKYGVVFLVLVSLVLTAVLPVLAEETGPDVLRKVDDAMRSDNKIMTEKMTLINSSGEARVREIQVHNKRTDANRMLVRFLSPSDVKGTGFLLLGDDMWLYLPALGKVRRIAGHARKGSFMGSDMSYEDMEDFGSTGFSEDFTAVSIGSEKSAGEETVILNLTPKTDNGSYSRLKMWVSQTYYLPRKIEYFDAAGDLEKTLTTSDIQHVDGRWVATSITVENGQKGSKTILEVTNVSFDQLIDDLVFTTRYLERGK